MKPNAASISSVAVFALTLMLTFSMALTACAGAADSLVQEVDVENYSVTARDLEVARQMQAPERVIESMEAGEWLYPSDREAVRYAEIAIDHMMTAHGQACEARWASVPWVLEHEAKVDVVAVGGDHDGVEATVRVSSAEGHPCTDDWYLAVHREEIEQIALDSLEKTLEGIPRKTWIAQASLRNDDEFESLEDDESVEEVLKKRPLDVSIYYAASVVPDKDVLQELLMRVLGTFETKGYAVYVWTAVVPDTPDGSAMTVEYCREQLAQGNKVMSTYGNWKRV